MNLPCEWFPAVGTAESAEGDHVENADDAEGEVVVQAKMMMKALLSCALKKITLRNALLPTPKPN